MRSTSTPRGVDCEGLGGRKIIGGGWSTVASSVEGGSPVGAWTRGHRDSSSGQRGTMDVSTAQGGNLVISFINFYKLTILTYIILGVAIHANHCLRHGYKVFTCFAKP
jgi:hypothetical protein